MAGQHISLAEVTRANWRATLELSVAPAQQRFIADYAPIAALGLAKAYIRPGDLLWTPYAFLAHNTSEDGAADAQGVADGLADGVMVGFALLAHEPQDAQVCWLFHFFIDQRYQGRGYGGQALQRLLTRMRATQPQCRAAQLTVHPQNERAQRLYVRAGFRPTGDLLDGEPLYRLEW